MTTMNKSNVKRQTSKVLVTGGAGFIGSQVAQCLMDEGLDVVVVDDLSFGRKEYVPKGASFRQMDIRDPKLLDIFLKEKPEYVFHLAAQIDVRVSVARPIHDAEINVLGALQVLEGAVKCGAKRLIFSSSGGAIYHDPEKIPTPETEKAEPISPYGVAKRVFELYLIAAKNIYGLDSVALRYANVYGPRQDSKGEAGVIGIFVKKMLAGETPVLYGDGKTTRDFVFVEDVVEANIRAMRSKQTGIFNIGTGVETSINALEKLVREATGMKTAAKREPGKSGEERRSCLDASLAKKVLGWTPKVGIEEGINRTVAWFRER